ncbi:hypothetical protein L9F63_007698, partial [Diploptera punctata]
DRNGSLCGNILFFNGGVSFFLFSILLISSENERIYGCVPQIIPYKTTSASRNITPILLFIQSDILDKAASFYVFILIVVVIHMLFSNFLHIPNLSYYEYSEEPVPPILLPKSVNQSI